jgi:hypothetical protein
LIEAVLHEEQVLLLALHLGSELVRNGAKHAPHASLKRRQRTPYFLLHELLQLWGVHRGGYDTTCERKRCLKELVRLQAGFGLAVKQIAPRVPTQ